MHHYACINIALVLLILSALSLDMSRKISKGKAVSDGEKKAHYAFSIIGLISALLAGGYCLYSMKNKFPAAAFY